MATHNFLVQFICQHGRKRKEKKKKTTIKAEVTEQKPKPYIKYESGHEFSSFSRFVRCVFLLIFFSALLFC